ncbi:endonuclease/exonuclease/phosphatase family protein [Dyadobacter tibetensis]|uniref:endonuclease/exonuclease/phosphatase family protein n=1 Tax=Dyadobacter tibetensis TaxID=1211851 RepID=UPI0004728CE5|nr:endonuclease/exonuclease/phosphatase family protein [Dyadobacter tibetensis]
MRRLYSFVSFFTIILTFLIYLGYIQGWVLGVLGLGYPVLLLFHLFCLGLILIFSPRNLLWPLLVFGSFLLLLPRTYRLDAAPKNAEAEDKKVISVLSYNVGNYTKSGQEVSDYLQWLLGQEADVLLLPEYSNWTHRRTLDNIRKTYPYYHTLQHRKHKALKNTVRLTVFSKYPIVAARDTLFQVLNGIVQADIAIGKDTLSIFGTHLFSMSLQIDKLVKEKDKEELEKGGVLVMRKLKNGFLHRKGEVDLLEEWIKEAKHPVIVGGDFNETPYSYSYNRMRKRLSNAFEEGGSGFGFTYNSLPYFIRIDQQFYDANKLELVKFETHRDIFFSDHFPLTGVYRLK